VRALSKLAAAPRFFVAARLRCSDMIISSKFHASPSVDILGKYRYMLLPHANISI
jgi:hypothetical protein